MFASCRPNPWKIVLIFAYMAALALVSVIPMDPGAAHIRFLVNMNPALQNVLHLPAYAALTILWMQVLTQRGRHGLSRLCTALLLGAGFGLANEAMQILIPGRYPSLMDTLANLAGSGLGVLVYIGVERRSPGTIRRLICT